jgi:hypothetical protein
MKRTYKTPGDKSGNTNKTNRSPWDRAGEQQDYNRSLGITKSNIIRDTPRDNNRIVPSPGNTSGDNNKINWS